MVEGHWINMGAPFGVKQYINEVNNHLRPAVGQLMNLVKKQYGCDLRYRILEVITEPGDLELRQDLAAAGKNPVYRDKIIYLPVYQDGDVVGAAEVTNIGEITAAQIQRIGQLASLIIQPRLKNFERLIMLKTLEQQLTDLAEESNVVPIGRLRRMRQNKELSDSEINTDVLEFKTLTPEPLRPKRRVRFQFPVMIHGKCSADIHKMAIELHYHSHRIAFLQFDQLKYEDTINVETYRELGPVTLFIPNVSSLDAGQQRAILAYLDGFRHEDSPQIIAGTEVSYKQLIATGVPSADLVRRVAVAYLQMTKPFAYYREKNIVDFFYESLTVSGHHGFS